MRIKHSAGPAVPLAEGLTSADSATSALVGSDALGAAVSEPLALEGRRSSIGDLVDLPPRAMRRSSQNRKREVIVRAAYHQLAVQRMSADQRAGHDPRCQWCQVRVPWKQGAPGNASRLKANRPGEGQPGASAQDSGRLDQHRREGPGDGTSE